MKYLEINGMPIELEKKRIKNMYLRILPPDGRVHVSAPVRMSDEEIERFVLSKLEWILIQQIKIRNRNINQEHSYVTGEKLDVWGLRLTLIVREDSARNTVKLLGDSMILEIKKESNVKREKLIKEWYRNSLIQEIPPLLLKWEKIIGVKSSGFHIRDMKTRWGTCNIRTKNICLNLQLAKKPPICLEYVIVHELVHLLERSHNVIFKAYMDRFLPQWRMIKKRLNE